MAIQSSFYLVDGSTRTFPSTKHIATKQHCAVYLKDSVLITWSVVPVGEYSLINNSIVFDTAPSATLYSEIEIRVVDTQGEIVDSPSDIAQVSGSINNINTVATNISSVNTSATNIGAINTTSGSISNVNTVSANIANINLAVSNTANINAVVANEVNVTAVGLDLLEPTSEINTVATSITNVNTVGLAIDNVNTNATNIASINTNATNIVTIQNASTNATTATTQAGIATTQATNSSNSATLSYKWANELENVVVTGGEYSAHHWAIKAAASAGGFAGFYTSNPTMNSTASAGVANTASRGDHVHPIDTSRAPLSSPTFTGTPAAPTATAGTNTTQLATTAFVTTADALKANLAGPTFTGVPNAPTAAVTTNTTQIATTAFVNAEISNDAVLKSGATMTGAITALRETKVAMGANDIALASGNLFTKTITVASTLTVSGWLASGNANSFILELTNGGAFAVTWFAGVKWASGTAPTLTASGVDILGFYSHDGGTTVRGIVLSKDSK